MSDINANALITEAELEELLQKTFDTAYANTLINIASGFIQNFCDRKFIEATYTREAYDGNGTKDLYLKQYPINASPVITVELWDTYGNVVSETFTLYSDYLVYLTEGRVYKRSGWIATHQRYRITYKAGYAIANVPYDLKHACAQIASFVDRNKTSAGTNSETIGKYSINYGSSNASIEASLRFALPTTILSLLSPYKRFT